MQIRQALQQMTDPILTIQAALLYRATPELNFADLRDRLNATLASSGIPPLEDSPLSSDQFALFRNTRLHISIAVHRTPLPAAGLKTALAAPASRSKRCDFERLLAQSHAHVILSVGDGPTPAALEPVTPAPAAIKLALLNRVMALVHERAPAIAAHLCTNDLFFTPAEIDAAAAQQIPPGMVMHPLKADGPARALRLCNSEVLIGKVLEIHDIPTSVPVSMQLTLANTLVTQHLAGALPLEDGDRLEDAVGMALSVRHGRPASSAPKGRIIVSFDSPDLPRAPRWEVSTYQPHPGYAASPTPPEAAPPGEARDWQPPPRSSYRGRVADVAGKSSSNWMIWVGIGLFLWIGLPLLHIPQMVLQAAFSDAPLLSDQPPAAHKTR